MKTIQLIAPMSGYPDYNAAELAKMEFFYTISGWKVINPFNIYTKLLEENNGKDPEYKELLGRTIFSLGVTADAAAVHPDFEKSESCLAEIAFCTNSNIRLPLFEAYSGNSLNIAPFIRFLDNEVLNKSPKEIIIEALCSEGVCFESVKVRSVGNPPSMPPNRIAAHS